MSMWRALARARRQRVSLAKRLRPYEGVEAESYDAIAPLYGGDLAWWQRALLEAPRPIVELGAGSGRLTLGLARRNARIIGLDQSPSMVRQYKVARAALGEAGSSSQFLLGEFKQLPFSEGSIGTFFLSHNTIFAVDRAGRRRLLRQIGRQLGSRGTLIFALDPEARRRLPRIAHVTVYRRRSTGGGALTEVSAFARLPGSRLVCLTMTGKWHRKRLKRQRFSAMVEFRPSDQEVDKLLWEAGLSFVRRELIEIAPGMPSEIVIASRSRGQGGE